MDQDFAKRRARTPLAEPGPQVQPSNVGLLMTGLVTGVAIGLFASLLVYLSGILPPSPGQPSVAQSGATDVRSAAVSVDDADTNEPQQLTIELEREAARLQLEFYQELPNYEVVVDVTPVYVAQPRTVQTPLPDTTRETESAVATSLTTTTAASEPPATPAIEPLQQGSFLLQAGAFQQQNTAEAQANRLIALGLSARVRPEFLTGRTLFLVQAGPYSTRDEMIQAERLLRSNNIETMRITLSQP